jgi:hypothetical protein
MTFEESRRFEEFRFSGIGFHEPTSRPYLVFRHCAMVSAWGKDPTSLQGRYSRRTTTRFSALVAGLLPMFIRRRISHPRSVMENTYVISWKSKSEPRSGHGKKLFTREDAQALAHQLNCDYPLFFHQALNLATINDPPAPSVIVPVAFQSSSALDDLDLTFAAAATEVPHTLAAFA